MPKFLCLQRTIFREIPGSKREHSPRRSDVRGDLSHGQRASSFDLKLLSSEVPFELLAPCPPRSFPTTCSAC
jgi:hypothetical protein